MGSLLDAVLGASSIGNDMASAQQRGQRDNALLQRQLRLQDQNATDQQALHAATMRQAGFIPDAERGPDQRIALPGQGVDQVVGAATGGVPGGALLGAVYGHPAATAPRYGASTGGYSYDYGGVHQNELEAKLGQTKAQTNYLLARPDIANRTLDVRQSEGQANRDSRESQTADRLATQQTIAANRDAIRLQIHRENTNPDGTPKPVTGTALLNMTGRLAAQYRKPTYMGGLGMNQADAMRQAMQDAREMAGMNSVVENGTTSAPSLPRITPPNSFSRVYDGAQRLRPPSGSADGAPQTSTMDLTTGAVTSGPPQSGVPDPLNETIRRIRAGRGTLQQLKAAGVPDQFYQAVADSLRGNQ